MVYYTKFLFVCLCLSCLKMYIKYNKKITRLLLYYNQGATKFRMLTEYQCIIVSGLFIFYLFFDQL